jgi:hypothetical protein
MEHTRMRVFYLSWDHRNEELHHFAMMEEIHMPNIVLNYEPSEKKNVGKATERADDRRKL